MQVFIWVVCFVVATVLNSLLGYATGIKVGFLLFYAGVYFVAQKLCQKWDEHKENKKITSQPCRNDIQPVAKRTHEHDNTIRFCRKCGAQLLVNSKFCRICGSKIVTVHQGQ